jgi:hypothetical protein
VEDVTIRTTHDTTPPALSFVAARAVENNRLLTSLLQHFPHKGLLLDLKFLVGQKPLRMEVGELAELADQVRVLSDTAGFGRGRRRSTISASCD